MCSCVRISSRREHVHVEPIGMRIRLTIDLYPHMHTHMRKRVHVFKLS
jgi:hypothetical protein